MFQQTVDTMQGMNGRLREHGATTIVKQGNLITATFPDNIWGTGQTREEVVTQVACHIVKAQVPNAKITEASVANKQVTVRFEVQLFQTLNE